MRGSHPRRDDEVPLVRGRDGHEACAAMGTTAAAHLEPGQVRFVELPQAALLHEHHQGAVRVGLGGQVHKEHAGQEVHALAVPHLRVQRRVRLQDVHQRLHALARREPGRAWGDTCGSSGRLSTVAATPHEQAAADMACSKSVASHARAAPETMQRRLETKRRQRCMHTSPSLGTSCSRPSRCRRRRRLAEPDPACA